MVDTSVFVESLRGRRVELFDSLVRSNAAVLSPYVRLELLQGVRKSEMAELVDVLGGLRQLPWREDLFPIAEKMLARLKGTGLKVGIVDLLIAAQAQQFGCALLSFDAVFGKLAKLGLVEPAK